MASPPQYNAPRQSRRRGLLATCLVLGASATLVQGVAGMEKLSGYSFLTQPFIDLGGRKPLFIVYSHDGRAVLVVEECRTESSALPALAELRIYDGATGRESTLISDDVTLRMPPDFTSDGRYVIYRTGSETWRYDRQTGKQVSLLHSRDCAFSRRGDVLACFDSTTSQLVLRSVKTQKVVQVLSKSSFSHNFLFFSPDGRWLCWDQQWQDEGWWPKRHRELVLYDRVTQRLEPTTFPLSLSSQCEPRQKRIIAFTLDSQNLVLSCPVIKTGLWRAPGLLIYALDQHKTVCRERMESPADIHLPLHREAILMGNAYWDKIYRGKQGWREAPRMSDDLNLWAPSPDGAWVLRPSERGLVKIPRAQALAELGL